MHLARFAQGLGHLHPELENRVLFRTIDSTNAFARRLVEDLQLEGLRPRPTVIAALHQSQGRGRQGRSWSSPPGLGVSASLVVPLASRQALPVLPLLVAVALCTELNEALDGRCRLKWPNDLMVGGRKLAGVLIEVLGGGESGPLAVIGFGVNHGQRQNELPGDAATSLRMECGRLPSLPRVTGRLVTAVMAELEHLDQPGRAIERYRELSDHRAGERLRCRTGQGVVEGSFAGYDARGFLRLATPQGELLLPAGEIEDEAKL